MNRLSARVDRLARAAGVGTKPPLDLAFVVSVGRAFGRKPGVYREGPALVLVTEHATGDVDLDALPTEFRAFDLSLTKWYGIAPPEWFWEAEASRARPQ